MTKFNIGDKVHFINIEKHEETPSWYPVFGTVGTVLDVSDESEEILVDWGDVANIFEAENGEKAWWCSVDDVVVLPKIPVVDLAKMKANGENYTNEEVWEMLKPKMAQFTNDETILDCYCKEVKDMIVAAYRSGYGRAKKSRPFMIKPRREDGVLAGKIAIALTDIDYLVTMYEDGSHDVATFLGAEEAKDTEGKDNVKINGCVLYDSAGVVCGECFNWLNWYVDDGYERTIYVAVPFKDVRDRFDYSTIKAIYCKEKPMTLGRAKRWAIGQFNGIWRFGNKYNADLKFVLDKGEWLCCPALDSPDFKALVPLHDYLKYKGVNV